MTLTDSVATINFDQALRAAATRAKACYPTERCRIEHGLQIVLADGVDVLSDGTALVQSQETAGATYRVHGRCGCRDEGHAPGGRCKHTYAKALYKAALAAVRSQLPPERWWATYYGPEGRGVPGVAQWTPRKQCWLFIPEDGDTPLYVAIQALSLGGHVPTEEEQREADGDLAQKIGQPQYAAVDLDAAKAELAALKAKRQAQGWGRSDAPRVTDS